MTKLLFVVDDDSDHLAALIDLLDAAGYMVRGFSSAFQVLGALETTPDLLITDLRMPEMDGLSLLDALQQRVPEIPVLVISGHGDVAHAVQAMRAGAEDFLEKPYDAGHLLLTVERALRTAATRAEVRRLQSMLADPQGQPFLGESRALSSVRERIAALAPLDVDIVIHGETGTGKELAARHLHAQSTRASGPYIAVNCAAIPEGMFETLMFGHAEGAFAGAGAPRAGKIEAANGGTLLLDEIEGLPLASQAKLLRVLQERAVERLGEHHARPVDIRVITTTKTGLRAASEAGTFRSDLYFRLAGAELHLPPLRDTGDDIGLIFTHYAVLVARQYGRQDVVIDFALRRLLQKRAWPGNVRELKAAAKNLALGLNDLRPDPSFDQSSGPDTLADKVAAYEAREIAAALERHRGNTQKAADSLGIPRRTLNDKMRRYDLAP